MVLSHLNVSDSDTHAQDLLQLELNGGLDFGDLGTQIFVVGDWGREFTSCEIVSRIQDQQNRKITYPWRDRDPKDEESA